ncbi:hypothetical protein [Streptomyces sp. CBMA123]|uniref:hypothetical protein n=1 Tax=Streptomyces sp. CBMA123 TaxID=1896313 RepID=UPI0016620A4E|nr:hypothetical protein [Streptomyces sp. CBMA123]
MRNAAAVVRTVLAHGPLPRHRIAELTGLSAGTVTRLTARLAAVEQLVELPGAPGPRETGRPPVPLDLPVSATAVVGVHTGLLRTTLGLVDVATHCGRTAAVLPIVAELAAVAELTPAPALRADLRLARALVAADDDAEPLFEAALGHRPQRPAAGPGPYPPGLRRVAAAPPPQRRVPGPPPHRPRHVRRARCHPLGREGPPGPAGGR